MPDTTEVQSTNPVEVIPPPDDILYAFARQVCEERARVENESRLLDADVITGLANLLKIAAMIEARRINRESASLIDTSAT